MLAALVLATGAAATALPMSVGWYRGGVDEFVDCMPPETIDWSALTHLTYSHTEQSCQYVAGEYNCTAALNRTLLTRLTTAAHAHGVKVLLAVGWEASGPQPWDSPSIGAKFVGSVAAVVAEWGFDGVEYDVEAFPKANTTLRTLYTQNILIPTKPALLKAVPPSRATVGVCLAAYNYNPFVFVENSPALYSVIDFFNVMSYNWQSSPTSASHPFPSASATALTTLEKYGIPKEKLNMGIGWYTSPGGGSAVCSLAKSPDCAKTLEESPDVNVCQGMMYDGPAMSYEMARFAAAGGWGGVMTFCVNYDTHNTLLTPLGQGLRNGTLERRG